MIGYEDYKPYLFIVNRVDQRIIEEIYKTERSEPCLVTDVDDNDYPDISISMEGTLKPNGFHMDASDGLHYYL